MRLLHAGDTTLHYKSYLSEPHPRTHRRGAGASPRAGRDRDGHPPTDRASPSPCPKPRSPRILKQFQGNQPVGSPKVSGTFSRGLSCGGRTWTSTSGSTSTTQALTHCCTCSRERVTEKSSRSERFSFARPLEHFSQCFLSPQDPSAAVTSHRTIRQLRASNAPSGIIFLDFPALPRFEGGHSASWASRRRDDQRHTMGLSHSYPRPTISPFD